jgi:two-component system, sensor histidine kinase
MCRVLVIDHDATTLYALKSLLGSWGCEVITATSTAEAVSRLDGGVDAIVTDYRLHGQDSGVAAISAVRETMGVTVPAVVLTGDLEADGFVPQHSRMTVCAKPVTPGEMRRRWTFLVKTDNAAANGP